MGDERRSPDDLLQLTRETPATHPLPDMSTSIRTFAALLLSVAASCAGGGGPSSGGSNPPPPLPSASPLLAGLVAAAAGPGAVRVQWRGAPAGFEVALFSSSTRASVYAGAPVVQQPSGDALTLNGLVDGTVYYFGLGIREAGAGIYVPTGVVLRARPGAPLYVDAASTAANPDGLTPATAFPDVTSALLTAFLQGGGNVWIAGGAYDAAFLPLFSGVHVQGSFDVSFDLDLRDALASSTVWNVPAGASGVGVQGGDPPAVLDGLALMGNGAGTVGVDVVDAGLELRAVSVSGFTDRGIRLRNTKVEDYDLVVASSSSSGNGADGLSLLGAYDLLLDASSFLSNGQEGVDLGPLVALDGDSASLKISGCSFLGNGTEGLDASLNAPTLGGPTGGRFIVEIRGSRFEENGSDGCLVDVEYEAFPLWSANVLVRDSVARANRIAGFHVDADAYVDLFLHRLLATANAGDGILVSSEADPGVAVVAACVAASNQGSGIRATFGNRPIAASHCIVAGNLGGGISSDTVESSAASSIAWLQTSPWTDVRTTACTSTNDPTIGLFENGPEEYRLVLAVAGSTLTLAQTPSFQGAAALELADDGIGLTASQISGTSVTLGATPSAFVAPGMLAAFAPGAGVLEDYHLPVGSPALATGMTPPGGLAVDAGVYGAPQGGDPGAGDLVPRTLFRPVATRPALTQSLGANDPIVVTFSDDLASASVVPGAVRAVTASGSALAISTTVANGELVVDPPPAGWGTEPFELELHRFLASIAGDPFAAPLALPFTP